MSKPRRSFPTAALAVFLLGTVACSTLLSGLIGKSQDRIKVPHARHQEADLDCSTCHEGIFEAQDLTEAHLPKEAVCLECHGDIKEEGRCGVCHSQPDAPATYPRRTAAELIFSHANHLERVPDANCRVCHKELSNDGRPAPRPSMETCASCHEEHLASGECALCHEDLSRYPLRPVSLFSHKGDFLRAHARDGRSKGSSCALCHEQTFCADCHASTVAARVEMLKPERVDRAFIHRGDYESRHSVEAKAEPALCQRCHGEQFCESCHVARGIGPGQDPALLRNPHPPGFADPASPSNHGHAARKDIVRCAACHDQGAASNCVECHRVGGVGGDPHPASFKARHGHEEINRNGMCLVCHR